MGASYTKRVTLPRDWYRIGDVARLVNEEPHVLRFWQDEFPVFLRTPRSSAGQRWYSRKELNRFKLLKFLLRTELYTIEGARRQLKRLGDFADVAS